MLTKLISIMPKCIAVFIIRRILDYCLYVTDFKIAVNNFWVKYYLNKLKSSKNYYKTLSALNSNKFCSAEVNPLFIGEAGSICKII